MKPRIFTKFLQQAENVGNSKFALSTVHQLDGLTIL
jgi:hypothetical protein